MEFVGMLQILPANAIEQFLEMANHIKRCENEIRMLEQNLLDSQQLVAELCNLNASISDMDTGAAPIFTSNDGSCTDDIVDALALTAVYLHLIHFAAFQRN